MEIENNSAPPTIVLDAVYIEEKTMEEYNIIRFKFQIVDVILCILTITILVLILQDVFIF